MTYVNKTQGFYLQDPEADTKDGVYAHIKLADAPDAKVGNKLNVKVTKYKKFKAGSDSGDGLLQIVTAELKKVSDGFDISTIVQPLSEGPSKPFVSELVKVDKLKITSFIDFCSKGSLLTLYMEPETSIRS